MCSPPTLSTTTSQTVPSFRRDRVGLTCCFLPAFACLPLPPPTQTACPVCHAYFSPNYPRCNAQPHGQSNAKWRAEEEEWEWKEREGIFHHHVIILLVRGCIICLLHFITVIFFMFLSGIFIYFINSILLFRLFKAGSKGKGAPRAYVYVRASKSKQRQSVWPCSFSLHKNVKMSPPHCLTTSKMPVLSAHPLHLLPPPPNNHHHPLIYITEFREKMKYI